MSRARDPSRRLGVAGAAIAASFLLGCAELPPEEVPSPASARGILITQGEIERSGARDAWEAIRKAANHLRFLEDMDGDPIWIGAHRGSASVTHADEILLVVDGALMQNIAYLRLIPAQTVAYIQILSGAEGTSRYGLAAGNGVVVVRTISPHRGVVEGGGAHTVRAERKVR
ncbi:MAG: TonB-dependent receptor plug domain-containing protein [Gemmatimonadota bacterium]